MTNHLIEIIFRNIRADRIGPLLRELISKGEKIVNYNITCNSPEIDLNSEASIEKIFINKKNLAYL